MRAAPLAFLLACVTLAAHGASFDCRLARSPREKAVCASSKLSGLDSQLMSAYTATLHQLSPAAAAEVQADQRQWLRFINTVCAGSAAADLPDCLAEHYGTRLDQLTPGKGLLRNHDRVFFTRGYFVAVPESAADLAEQRESGGTVHPVDYGEFAWPEADKPNAEEAKWNRAVAAAALQAQGSPTPPDSKSAPHTFRGSVSDGYAYGFWSLSAANDRLISIDLGISTYGWGAAHPLTGSSSFNWWLREAREVTPDDVFRRGVGWQAQLGMLVLASLRKDPGADVLWKDKELHDGIAGELQQPRSWQLTSVGLTVNYGQYEVGPYAIGMPAATIPWRTLMPLLNPSLLPETLPAPVPRSEAR